MSKPHIAHVFALAMVSVASWSGVAAAQSAAGGASGGSGSPGGSCPPGSWFCAPPPQQKATPAGQPVDSLQQLPDPEEAPPPPPPRHVRRAPPPEPPPPPVVYEPPPVGAMERSETPPPYEYAPPGPPYPSPRREWGLNLHLEGATIGHGSQGDASMAGFGAGLRYKPTRHFGIEGDLDVYGGHDYSGNNRSETAFALNGLLFLNPRSHVQVYLLGGIGFSGAHVSSDATPYDASYHYFGAQAGAGLEFRLTHTLAFNFDFRGFIRGRTDGNAQSNPEFVDAYGRTTNTSGGGLFTGGMTLYF